MNKTQAFNDLAPNYQKSRSSYPEELLAKLRHFFHDRQSAEWPAPLTIADIGCGTGISTRLLWETFGPRYFYIGVEPGEAMRTVAFQNTNPDLRIQYIEGQGEALPFEDSSVVMVVAAQAVQWFERSTFYAEAQRILLPEGTLALMQNNRNWKKSKFLDAYEEFLELYGDNYTRFYRDFDLESELRILVGFGEVEKVVHEWTRLISVSDFISMSLSSTKMQSIVKKLGKSVAVTLLKELIDKYATSEESLGLLYTSELFMARRVKP